MTNRTSFFVVSKLPTVTLTDQALIGFVCVGRPKNGCNFGCHLKVVGAVYSLMKESRLMNDSRLLSSTI